MTDALYLYNIYCTTESAWVQKWDTVPPTTCPNNNTHTVNASSVYISNQIQSNTVKIQEETTPTGAHFAVISVPISAPANATTVVKNTWPFPVSALSIDFITTSDHVGDTISLCVAANSVIGVTTANIVPASAWSSQNYVAGNIVTYDASIGLGTICYTCIVNTVGNAPPTNKTYWVIGLFIPVNSTVITNIAVGFHVNISDGVHNDSVYRVTGVDTNNSYIYVEQNLSHSFNAGSLVLMTVCIMDTYIIGNPGDHTIGRSTIGGKYIPAGIPVSITYVNKSVSTDKTFIGNVEYLY